MKMPGNMQNMMKQAQAMQQKLQEQIAAIRVEASAGRRHDHGEDGRPEERPGREDRSGSGRAMSRCCRTW